MSKYSHINFTMEDFGHVPLFNAWLD